MLEFSPLFILFELLKQILGFTGYFFTEKFGWIALCVSVFLVVLSHFFSDKSDPNKINLRGVFQTFSWIAGACGIISLMINFFPRGVDYIHRITAIEPELIYKMIIIPLFVFFILFLFIYGKKQSKETRNDSRLNQRQFTLVWLYFLVIASVFYLLWSFFFPFFKEFILFIFFMAEVLSVFFWFYDPVIYMAAGVFQKKPKPTFTPTPGKYNRLAVIGCAHNEEKVIDGLIESVFANTYPRDKYDIYVICDNCDDDTASIVRSAGAIAMERNEPDARGKGFGLQWMFEQLSDMALSGENYDAYVILDADNIINNKYLELVNDYLNEGYEILQTYLGCKNAHDTWISKSYSLSYWLSNNTYQKAHSNIGLSAQMGGTGMIFRPSVLQDIGWHTDSLTEDLLLTTRYVLIKNSSCCWIHDAQLFDEKPLKIKPSSRQRTRWMQGHIDSMIQYVPLLLKTGILKRSFKMIDVAMYLIRPLLNLFLFICYFIRCTSIILFPSSFVNEPFIMNATTASILILSHFLLQVYALREENHLRALIWIPIEWIYSFTWYIPIFRGLVKHRERYWVSTVHTRKMGLQEIEIEDIPPLKEQSVISDS